MAFSSLQKPDGEQLVVEEPVMLRDFAAHKFCSVCSKVHVDDSSLFWTSFVINLVTFMTNYYKHVKVLMMNGCVKGPYNMAMVNKTIYN